MADPAYSRASILTLPKECSLSLPAAYRGLLLGSPFPSLLLHLQSLFIYLWKLQEPEPAAWRDWWSQRGKVKKPVSGPSVCL